MTTPPEASPTGKQFFQIVFCLLVLVLIAYGNTLLSPFNYDDEIVIRQEIAATGDRFYQLYPPVYRHLFYLSLTINHSFGGLNPLGYHLFNITLHFFTAVAVLLTAFLTLHRGVSMNKKDAVSMACITAFLFALHPVHSETVTYISARATGLAAFFYLLSLLLFILGSLRRPGLRFLPPLCYLLSWAAFFAAVLSKETALTLPAIVFVYDLIFMRGNHWNLLRSRIYYYYFPLMAGVVLMLTLSPSLLTMIQVWLPKLDLSYALSQIKVIAYAVKLLFIPINLTFDYDFNPRFFAQGTLLVPGVIIFLALGYAAIRKIPKARGLFVFSIFWFLITLSPTNSFLPRPDLLSERNLYLPSFGLILLGAVLIATVLKSTRNRFPALSFSGLGCLALILILFSALLMQRNATYRSNILLWEDTVKKAPGKLRALHNLSHFYLAEKKYQAAFVSLKKLAASKASPFYRSIAHNNLGHIYTDLEDPVQAEKEFLEAIRTDPTIPTGYFNLASLHAAQGRFRLAREAYEQAEKRYALYRWGYTQPAELAFNKAKVNFSLGLYEEAERDIARYLQRVPGSAEGRLLSGKVFAALGEKRLAIDAFKSVQGNPLAEARAHNNLGILYIQNKQPEEAIQEFKISVALNPNEPDAHYNLALLMLETKGSPDQARQHLEMALNLNRDPARRESIQKRLLAMEK
jgi:protein O-mannosyl-transferase